MDNYLKVSNFGELVKLNINHLTKKSNSFGKIITLPTYDGGIYERDIPFEDVEQRINYYEMIRIRFDDFNPYLSDRDLLDGKYQLAKLAVGSQNEQIYNYYQTFAVKKLNEGVEDDIEIEILKKTTQMVISQKISVMPMMYANKSYGKDYNLIICEINPVGTYYSSYYETTMNVFDPIVKSIMNDIYKL